MNVLNIIVLFLYIGEYIPIIVSNNDTRNTLYLQRIQAFSAAFAENGIMEPIVLDASFRISKKNLTNNQIVQLKQLTDDKFCTMEHKFFSLKIYLSAME